MLLNFVWFDVNSCEKKMSIFKVYSIKDLFLKMFHKVYFSGCNNDVTITTIVYYHCTYASQLPYANVDTHIYIQTQTTLVIRIMLSKLFWGWKIKWFTAVDDFCCFKLTNGFYVKGPSMNISVTTAQQMSIFSIIFSTAEVAVVLDFFIFL